jgi:hypothetical protein
MAVAPAASTARREGVISVNSWLLPRHFRRAHRLAVKGLIVAHGHRDLS